MSKYFVLVALFLVGTSCGAPDTISAPPSTTAAAVSTTVAPTTTVPPTTTAAPTTTVPPTTTAAPTTTTTTTLPPQAPTIAELLALDRPLNIAHAGGDQDYPHSTMYAFSQAVAAGADMLEMDVRITADGVLVVHHDNTAEGTTGMSGSITQTTLASGSVKTVADLSLEELQVLDNAYWWSPTCWPCRELNDDQYPFRGVRTGEVAPPEGFTADDFRIETFRSIAEAFPGLPLDIEIKDEGALASQAIDALIAILDDLDRRDSVVVVSFSSDIVAEFKAAAPDVATSPGTDELVAWVLGGEPLVGHLVVQVPPFYGDIEVLTESFFDAANLAAVEVWVWTSETTQEAADFYAEMLTIGVDGIITGRPEVTAKAIADAQ
ncbi:MAG: glycerophosphodiester phosphodiesterase family protein [Acidimicrobiales bacterium]|nr:glycerophosphodiester phosphodiesterase family protein [Acidimicrobiales bacterium]